MYAKATFVCAFNFHDVGYRYPTSVSTRRISQEQAEMMRNVELVLNMRNCGMLEEIAEDPSCSGVQELTLRTIRQHTGTNV